jgi:hypothetical protein
LPPTLETPPLPPTLETPPLPPTLKTHPPDQQNVRETIDAQDDTTPLPEEEVPPADRWISVEEMESQLHSTESKSTSIPAHEEGEGQPPSSPDRSILTHEEAALGHCIPAGSLIGRIMHVNDVHDDSQHPDMHTLSKQEERISTVTLPSTRQQSEPKSDIQLMSLQPPPTDVEVSVDGEQKDDNLVLASPPAHQTSPLDPIAEGGGTLQLQNTTEEEVVRESLPQVTEDNVIEETLKTYSCEEIHLFYHYMKKEIPTTDETEPEPACSVCHCTCNCACRPLFEKSECFIGYKFNEIKKQSVKAGATVAAVQWKDLRPIFSAGVLAGSTIFKFGLFVISLFQIVKSAYQIEQVPFDVLKSFFSLVGALISLSFVIVASLRRHEAIKEDLKKLKGLPGFLADRLWKCVHFLHMLSDHDLLCCGRECSCCNSMKKGICAVINKCCCNVCCKGVSFILKACCVGCYGCCTGVVIPFVLWLGRKLFVCLKTCCSCCSRTGVEEVRQVFTCKGQVRLIIGNFSEIILSVIDEILATILLILSLYSFIGGQKYLLFHGVMQWRDVFSLIFALGSFLFYLKSHAFRLWNILSNVRSFDKDIAKGINSNSKLTGGNCCIGFLTGFQWRVVIHTGILSLLQIYCLFALAWKIIRDHCVTPEEAARLAVSTTSTPAMTHGPLGYCTIPSLGSTVNYYTLYSIFYISIILPIMSYILLFVSNLPILVEYSELLHVSGLYKFEDALGKVDEEKGSLGLHKINNMISIFIKNVDMLAPRREITKIREEGEGDVINPNLEKIKKKRIDLQRLRKAIEDDLTEHAYTFLEKAKAVVTSIPVIAVGVVHCVLFLVHIGFLSCRLSPFLGVVCSSDVDIFNIFTMSVNEDKALLIIPLLLLFVLVGFPGPLIVMLWAAIVAMAAMVLVLIVMACVCLSCVLHSPPERTTTS